MTMTMTMTTHTACPVPKVEQAGDAPAVHRI
jgi:hypothetical protein